MINSFSQFLFNDDAATAVEYAVMLALILMVCFSAIALVGTQLNSSWSDSDTKLKAVNFGS